MYISLSLNSFAYPLPILSTPPSFPLSLPSLIPPLLLTLPPPLSSHRAPYLLVASVFNIHKMYPNGSGLQAVVSDSGISAVACHYRYI